MDALERYLDYRRYEVRRAVKTVKADLDAARRLERRFRKPVTEIDKNDLRELRRDGSFSSSTIAMAFTFMKGFHRWGALIEDPPLWELNGIMAIEPPVVTHNSPEPLTEAEARILLDACENPHEFRLVHLPLLAGVRIDEAVRMHGSTWRSDRLTFIGKNGKKRSVPIHAELEQVRGIIAESRLKGSSRLYDIRDILAERTGIFFTPHQLRHTFGNTLFDTCEVPWEVVQDLMGHSLGTTGIYVRVPWRMKVEAMAVHGYRGT